MRRVGEQGGRMRWVGDCSKNRGGTAGSVLGTDITQHSPTGGGGPVCVHLMSADALRQSTCL